MQIIAEGNVSERAFAQHRVDNDRAQRVDSERTESREQRTSIRDSGMPVIDMHWQFATEPGQTPTRTRETGELLSRFYDGPETA
jgi:hypothetical protein